MEAEWKIFGVSPLKDANNENYLYFDQYYTHGAMWLKAEKLLFSDQGFDK